MLTKEEMSIHVHDVLRKAMTYKEQSIELPEALWSLNLASYAICDKVIEMYKNEEEKCRKSIS